MEIREVRAFAAVAEEGSLSAAARRLRLSQSALSQTVQSLERQLGVQLLLRSRTGVVATEAGAILLREGRALIAQYERTLAAVAASDGASPGNLKVGIPLELPAELLPLVLAGLSAEFPLTRVEVRHASSASQFAELEAGRLDVALIRESPVDPRYDAVLAVEESLGVVLTVSHADELAEPTGIRLHRLAGLDWTGFPRSEAPVWYDQVAATLRAHGISVDPHHPAADGALIPEVKFAAVGTGHAFALAPPEWSQPLPPGVTWRPLIGNPLVRRTWAAWAASSRRRDLAALVAALDLTTRGQA
jgi:molybdate transport repressor ModE-like protein